MSKCTLSVVMVVFNMRREAPRTLFSLSPGYQRGVDVDDYEVIVMDNGSSESLSGEEVTRFGPNFRYEYVDTESRSPVAALNRGVELARSEWVVLIVDGARMLSPGVLGKFRRVAAAFHPQPAFIATLAWHLGPDLQVKSIKNGYDRNVEDRLLESVPWRENGYELFSIASLAQSSQDGWLLPVAESNCVCLPKAEYLKLGGFDTRFQAPGGGLANLDFFERALGVDEMAYVLLIGEGTFHQVHGGASTNSTVDRGPEFGREYRSIRNKPYVVPERTAELFGSLPPQCLKFMQISVEKAAQRLRLNKSGKDD